MSENDLNNVMCDLLTALQTQHHSDALSQLGEPNFDKAVENCIARGFVAGLQAQRTPNGRLTVDAKNVSITDQGLQFIAEHTHRSRH